MLSLKENASVMGLAVLLALVIAPAPLAISLSAAAALAQTSNPNVTFPLPESAPSGMKIRINGSSSMVFINQALAQRFENQFPATETVSNYTETKAALQALLEDQIDLAAISRLLTAAEKAQGLVSVPLTRHKIAMIVGVDNPFKGDLTVHQFAQIFRGEITDWSEVGGPSLPIRKIDRPHSSDTRKAFQNYLIFQDAAFETGANAVTLARDSTEVVIRRLGVNGISYAIADQVLDNPNVRIVPMHDVLPDDPRYPFSQPLSYVYKGPEPNPAVQAFLGYAADPSNESAIEAARVKGAIAAIAGELTLASAASTVDIATFPEAVNSEEMTAQAPTTTQNRSATAETRISPEGWFLILLVLGIPLLLWLIKERRSPKAAAPAAETQKNRLILVPRSSQTAFAYWEVADTDKQALRRQNGRRYMLRLYDVTGIDPAHQTPHNMKQFECDPQTPYKHLPIDVSDREYRAELGYVTSQGHWLKIASSDQVHIPSGPPELSGAETETAPPTIAAMAMESVAAQSSRQEHRPPVADDGVVADVSHPQSVGESRIILTLRTPRAAYAYWEIPEAVKAAQRQAGGQRWSLRIHDVTGIDLDYQPPHHTQEYACDQQTQDMHVAIPMGDRDYLADLGYVSANNQWLSVIRSFHVRAPVEG